MVNFEEIFDRLMGHEGRYSNDPDDPGGETNWGISKRSYPHLIIKELTRENAKDIYFRDFWNPLQMMTLPYSIAFQLFDFAVNSSINTAIRYFQRALGVADDGFYGPISKAKAAETTETDMIMLLNAERLDYMTKLKNWPHHGKGWTRRIANNLRYGSLDT